MQALTRPRGFQQQKFCPGCGHGVVARLLMEEIDGLGYLDRCCFALGVGCSCNLNSGVDRDKIQCAHGRAPSVATGIKRARPDLLTVAYQGDGDAAVIGIADTLNTAYRNENLTVIVVNNTNFGMTGGQMSWTTLAGERTATSREGRDCSHSGAPFHLPELIAREFDVAFAARGSVHSPKAVRQTAELLRKALLAQLEMRGYSIVEILATCPTNWGMSPVQCIERLEREVIAEYPLGIFKESGCNQ